MAEVSNLSRSFHRGLNATAKRMCPRRIAAGLVLSFAAAAGAADLEWPMFNGAYSADRWSPLEQINTTNVGRLVQVGRYELPETTSFQAGPVVVGGTLYVTTATGTYAVDARTGAPRWQHRFEPKSMGLGTPVRGVGFADGRVFRGTPDGRVLALDAQSGNVVWDVPAGKTERGEYFTVAPITWGGRVYIGTSGGDVASIGRVIALDAASGRQVWSFETVPSTGRASKTWSSDPAKKRAGGAMYSSFALDPEAGILYVPTGNAGPDFGGTYRPGANLYTCSVIALDARTGRLLGYHQFTPHDVHDWDVAASPMLYQSKSGRRMVAVASKNGYLYGLSRDLKKVAWQTAVTTIANVDAPLTAAGTRFAPGTQGGTNWYGPTYSPPLNLLFVPAIDWPTLIKLGGTESRRPEPGKPFLGSANMFGDSDEQRSGWLTAVDADTGQVRWRYHAAQPLVASVTPTAGGLVFTGDFEGRLLAFDAANGRELLATKVGGPIGGGIVTYSIEGTQYVAVAAGMKNDIMRTDSGPASVVILALHPGGTAPGSSGGAPASPAPAR